MGVVDDILGLAIDFTLWPLHDLLPVWQLVVVSGLLGVVLVVLYGKVSFQNRIRKVKREIHGLILESILFRHTLRVTIRAQLVLLWKGMVYFCLAIPPLLLLAIPCILLLAQLNLRFGVRPLEVGESGIIEVELRDPKLVTETHLAAHDGVTVTPPVRVEREGTVTWRVDADHVGQHELLLTVGTNEPVHTEVIVGQHRGALTMLTSERLIDRILYPSSLDISRVPIRRLSISYPDSSLAVFGYEAHWVLVFFLISLLTGLVGSRLLGIEV